MLAHAGVVDAGGRGLCVVLDAVETTATGRRPTPWSAPIGTHLIPVATTAPGDDLTEDGPGYEVMYLLDAGDAQVADLRATLSALGDSLVVVGGDGLWNVHVHVDDVGAAIEAGITAGRPHRIRVTHFADQVAGRRRTSTRTGRGVVAVAAGPGLTALFESAGAVVVTGGPGRRPSTGQLLEAIVSCGAAEVVVLPNDGDTVRAAEIAARTAEAEHDVDVEVIPTQAQVQGLAAISVHEPGRAFDADVREMTATARHARHGAVTVAARRAITMAGPCEPGDALGVIAGDFAVVGADLESVADEVLERLKRRMSTLRMGDPLDKNTDVGAINSGEQLMRIRELSQVGDAEGAERWEVACDLPTKGFWFPPTIFTGVSQAHRIAREEIFGPVLSVLTFRTPSEAIEKANNTPFGLSAGVWTDKGSRILSMANRLRAGVVWANTFNKFDPTSPFGGYKESGYGREGGRHGLEGYLKGADS
ncbi:hypothetical protein Pve01_87050 [Planomonospora venezuelensis]|nr:hypothetical protein Pve01_87050 [Planomonospora venezuelensis]